MRLLNNFLKSLLIVMPMLLLTGCPSTQDEGQDVEYNDPYGGQQTNGTLGGDDSTSGVVDEATQLQSLQQSNTIYFAYDRYDIASEYESLLNQHAAYLRNHPGNKVVIEGHADERGTSEYNIALGERRANSVYLYLQSQGVPADQLSIVSYGKEKPAVSGHSEEAYARNRRAVLVY